MRILAVDDDELFLEMLRDATKAAGFDDVTLAISASAAMQLAESVEVPFDCFFLDIQMPGIDGVKLCSWIRNHHRYRTVPILMITALSDREYIEQAFAAGATDYLTKPIDFLELSTRARLANRMSTLMGAVSTSKHTEKVLLASMRGWGSTAYFGL
jgi:DNA-binding response OmpR family regulator